MCRRYPGLFAFLLHLLMECGIQAQGGSIGDRVWLDADSNGIQDPGEPGLGQVHVELQGPVAGGGVLALTAITDPAGRYLFTDLTAGEYALRVATHTLPSGAIQTGDPDFFGMPPPPSSPDHQTVILLAADGTITNADFGYWAPDRNSQIGKRVYVDRDGNGDFSGGDAPVSAVTVTLLAGGAPVAETTTDAAGQYLFTGLAAGSYEVWISDHAGQLDSLEPRIEWDGTPDGRVLALVDGIYPVLYLDFGYVAARGSGRIAGRLSWQDAGMAIANHAVFLLAEDRVTVLADTRTDPDGRYAFEGLDPGPYVVRVAPYAVPGASFGYFIRFEQGRRIGSGNLTPVILEYPELQRADLDFGYEVPLLAVIGSVEAIVRADQTWVCWETLKTWNTVGFWLERQTTDGWSRLNKELLPAPLFGAEVAVYKLVDPAAVAGGTYRYRLVEMEADGTILHYGPYELTVDGPGRTYASWIARFFPGAGPDDSAQTARTADPDGDGLSNWQEFLAWTDPGCSGSVLRITELRMGANGMEIICATVPGRRYRLAVADSPGGTYLPLEPATLAVAETTVLQAPSNLGQAYWQVWPVDP